MTVIDQIKILDKKIMQNEAQYDLDRKAAKMPVLFSNNLKDLGLMPSTIEQGKFEYSTLDKKSNKGLDKDDRQEGLFKRLRNIENAQRNLINSNDGEIIYYTPRSQFDSEHDKDEAQKKQQNNNIDTKPLNVFD